MLDREARDLVLRQLYDIRKQPPPQRLEPVGLLEGWSQEQITRILFDLKEQNLIRGIPFKHKGGEGVLSPHISSFGIDVIEGSSPPPIAITVYNDARQYNVGSLSGDNVQVGDNNTQR